jgi:hypothetical protein
MFDRALFLRFADRMQKIKEWLEEHSMDDLERVELDTEDMFRYVGDNFDTDDIMAMWSGKEMTISTDGSLNLIPLMRDGE